MNLEQQHKLAKDLLRAARDGDAAALARIARFQGLVYSLLSTDVADWTGVAPEIGFYDQAHMINEFHEFAGAPPRMFFLPHGRMIDPAGLPLRGRPSEWFGDLGDR